MVKALPILADVGYCFPDTRCFWISAGVHSWFSSIQYPESNICPKNATSSRFPVCPVEKFLCNLEV
jgi:hypothetical protein